MHYLVELSIRIATIYGGIVAGFLLKRLPKINEGEKLTKILTYIGVNILTPILLIIVMLGVSDFGELKWGYIALFATLSTVLSLSIDWVLIHKRTIEPTKKGAELSAVAFMNSLFYPFPIIMGLVGASGLLSASIFLIVNIILRNSLGVVIGLHYGERRHQSLLKILKGMLFFPPTIAMLFGLIVRLSVSKKILSTDNLALDIFRDFTMILMLSIVGLKFDFPSKRNWREIPIARSTISRFGGGIIAVIPIFFLGLPYSSVVAFFIQSLSPPAVNNTAYANYFNLDGRLTSRLIAILTLIALIILPFEILILLNIR